jgi:hypothetical protein
MGCAGSRSFVGGERTVLMVAGFWVSTLTLTLSRRERGPEASGRERRGPDFGCLQDLLGDGIRRLQQVGVREANQTISFLLEIRGSLLVLICAIVVAHAVELDDQPHFRAVEIYNVGFDDMLPSELHAAETSVTKNSPENSLRYGSVTSQATTALYGQCRNGRLAGHR